MSQGNMHYPQQQQFHHIPQQPQQQHPLLAAVASGNNYAYNHPLGHYPAHVSSFRPAAGAGTSAYGVYFGSSPAEYGASASGSGYDYHHPAPAPHHPTGGGSSYHATADTGYGAPPLPPVPIATKAKKGSGGSSALTALTLLSFFFFVNLLQGCIKDQMVAMNPTVMVMTVGGARNRFNKLAEMNSREHSASSAASTNSFSSGASIVMKPADLVASASSSLVRSTPPPFILKTSPYSQSEGYSKPLANYNYNNNNNANKHSSNYKNEDNNNYDDNNKNNYDSGPEFYDSNAYPNQTHYSVMSNDKNRNQPTSYQQHAYQQQQQQQEHVNSSQGQSNPWSYGTSTDRQTSLAHRHHGSSTYSSWSTTPNRISGSKYFEDAVDDVDDDHDDDHRGDSYYTRIN